MRLVKSSVLAVALPLAMMAGAPPMLAATAQSAQDTIRPFKVHVPQEEIDNLRRRIAMTRWPDKETVTDRSQGFQLADLQQLLRYWHTRYDWRKAEAKLNAVPQFKTRIDGVDIHFIHVKSKHPHAMPLIITHGWPGSVFELIKTVDPLTNPTAHGGTAADAFDVVIPSIPGYGFSGKPTSPGWDEDRIARAWAELMQRLGYKHYVAQGGDWGAPITEAMGRHAPPGLAGIHVNLPAAVPMDVIAAMASGTTPPGLTARERAAFDALNTAQRTGARAYFEILTARPQAIGYGMTDSPAGLAGFILVHGGFSRWKLGGTPDTPLTTDEVLDDISLYWLTNSAASAGRLYWENRDRSPTGAAAQMTDQIKVPVAVTIFPYESYRAPETWARRAFPTLDYYHEVDKGGHFAAWEQPELFASELRAAFKPLR